MPEPSRGDVWVVDFGSTKGHEQAGRRPALVVSVDLFNHGPSGLVVVLPLTTKQKHVRFHVPLIPPEAGVRVKSFIKCENVRSLAKERLVQYWGAVSPDTVSEVEDRLRILMGL